MNSEGIYSERDYTHEEKEYADMYDLSTEQVAWMRWAIREECDDDFELFKQDYPFDEESAFLTSGRCRFNTMGIRYQRENMRRKTPTEGALSLNFENRTAFQVTEERDAMWSRFEPPKIGCRYLVAVDNMTGESQTGGDDPDSHGIAVIRAGYMKNGMWNEPAVVMHVKGHKDRKRFGVWWDTDILADEVYKVSRYYGDCLIVPEVNMDRGMIELLKLKGANIYRRKMFNRRENTRTTAYGFHTDVRTRAAALECLAAAIREAGRGDNAVGIELNSKWIIDECANFVVKPSGRAEAALGHHDDQVLAVAIGLFCIEEATTFAQQQTYHQLPQDLREDIDPSTRGIKNQLV